VQIWRGIGEVSGGARGAWPEGEGGGWVVRDGGEEGLGQECHHLFGCLCNRLHPTNLHPKLPAKCPAKLLGLAREFAREFAREISGACPRNCPRNFWGLPAKLTAKFLRPAREIGREIDRKIENEIENEMPRELPANSKHTRKCNICTGGAPDQNFENVFCVQHYGISFGQHSHNQGCMENGHAVAQVASLIICGMASLIICGMASLIICGMASLGAPPPGWSGCQRNPNPRILRSLTPPNPPI